MENLVTLGEEIVTSAGTSPILKPLMAGGSRVFLGFEKEVASTEWLATTELGNYYEINKKQF